MDIEEIPMRRRVSCGTRELSTKVMRNKETESSGVRKCRNYKAIQH